MAARLANLNGGPPRKPQQRLAPMGGAALLWPYE